MVKRAAATSNYPTIRPSNSAFALSRLKIDMKPLIYLEIRQFINAIKNTVRSPKRLIPALLIAAWAISWFVNGVLSVAGAPSPGQPGFGQWGDALQRLPKNIDMIRAAVFIFLCFGCFVVVYQSFTSGILIFSVAHIDFLFPTPISRRKVLLVKLIKDYMKYGFWVVFFFVVMGSPVLGMLNVNMFPYGFAGIVGMLALVITIVNVSHTVNIITTFGAERVKQAAAAVKVALWGVLASVIGAAAYQYMHTGDTYLSILWAADSPVLNAVFAPARWCSWLILAPFYQVTHDDYVHLGLLWLLAAGSFALLMSRRENVYEPSLGVSVKYANRRQALRSGDFTAVRLADLSEKGAKQVRGLTVAPFGQGAVALLWKNIIMRLRISGWQLALSIIIPIAGVVMLRQIDTSSYMLHSLPFTLPYVAWLASITSQPMRSELKQANILKAMPIAPWKVVMVQAISNAAFASIAVLALAAAIWTAFPDSRGPLLTGCTLMSPFIAFTCVSMVTIASMMYPDMRDAAQNYLCGMVGFLLAFLALMPSLALGAVMVEVARSPFVEIARSIALLNVLIGSACAMAAGAMFRRFDPTSE